jgi:hypothetical protein
LLRWSKPIVHAGQKNVAGDPSPQPLQGDAMAVVDEMARLLRDDNPQALRHFAANEALFNRMYAPQFRGLKGAITSFALDEAHDILVKAVARTVS